MPEMAFVYPMQEVTGAADAFVEAGGDYLLSFLGWDPGRLRLGNDIHAPALIRTGRLRALGGFATDPRLNGFEDYDLWCRMADRGWRGQLVPQELARRTESDSSRALSAIHPSPGDATGALMERAPTSDVRGVSRSSERRSLGGEDEVPTVRAVVGVVVGVVSVGLGPALA